MDLNPLVNADKCKYLVSLNGIAALRKLVVKRFMPVVDDKIFLAARRQL